MVSLAKLPILTGKIKCYPKDTLSMALDPLLLIILIIAAVFFVTFLLTYFTLSFFTREKETDYSPSSPKKVTKKVRSILERNLVDELFKTIPVNLLDPSSLV